MARQTASDVAGISMWHTPRAASASTMALITAAGAALGNLELLRPQQVVPRRIRIVVLEMAFPALNVQLRQLTKQFAVPSMSLKGLLFQEALGFLQTPVAERLLNLSQR